MKPEKRERERVRIRLQILLKQMRIERCKLGLFWKLWREQIVGWTFKLQHITAKRQAYLNSGRKRWTFFREETNVCGELQPLNCTFASPEFCNDCCCCCADDYASAAPDEAKDAKNAPAVRSGVHFCKYNVNVVLHLFLHIPTRKIHRLRLWTGIKTPRTTKPFSEVCQTYVQTHCRCCSRRLLVWVRIF